MNIRQHKFVTEYLRFGDHAIAYKNAYNSTATGKVIESAANRLMKNPEVAQAIADAQATIREKIEKEVAEQLKGELLTIQKKRELLYQIATGEMHVLQYHKGKDCNTCSQYVTPTINQMLRAIHLDNKLAGHYPYLQTVRDHNKTQQTMRKNPPPKLGGDIGENAESIGDNGGGRLAKDKGLKNHNIPIPIGTQQVLRTKSPLQGDRGTPLLENTEYDLSPAGSLSRQLGGRGVRHRRAGVEPLAQEKTVNSHNNSQQTPPSRHAELDSASGETPEKTMKKHNNSQQNSPACHPELSVAPGKTSKTITRQELNSLLSTEMHKSVTPRLLQFRRRQLTG